MRRLKVGIRPQLIILVMSLSLLLLLILAVVTGVYFSNNLQNLRAERLEVIAELKLTQIKQLLLLTFYQVNWITQRDQVLLALTSARAGNSDHNASMSGANVTIDQLVLLLDNFAAARLYNLDLEVLVELENKITNLSPWARDFLYPLRWNALVPPGLYMLGTSTTGYFTGPVANDTSSPLSTYFMCITLPIYANTLIILQELFLAGYILVIFLTLQIQLAMNDLPSNLLGAINSLIAKKTDVYNPENQVYLVSPVYGDAVDLIPYNIPPPDLSNSVVVAYKYLFPTSNLSELTSAQYSINLLAAVRNAILNDYGGLSSKIKLPLGNVATGFSKIVVDPSSVWTLIVEQQRLSFLKPVNDFKKIIIGVVIGIAAFMCIITFPLAVYFVKPITKLKEATVLITDLRKRKYYRMGPSPGGGSGGGGTLVASSGALKLSDYWGLLIRRRIVVLEKEEIRLNLVLALLGNRILLSLQSLAYSGGIKMPKQIKRLKKFFKDEITELTDAFNIMTAELGRQYNNLEDRVKQRTKELEALKLEAEAANEAKTVFIANISHELRTPLNGILGMTAIAMDEPDQLRIQELLKLIHRLGELLLHILTELLTYSKNTLKRSKLERANFQILEVVGQTKLIFDKLARDLRVNFSVLMKPAIMRKLILFGDLNRIIQIVMNLVLNSLKFTPVDGLVDVTFKLLGEYDYGRLAAVDFSRVFVKNSKKLLAAKALPPIPSRLKTIHSGRKGLATSTTLDDDIALFVTIATLEYEQALFDNQFSVKPLPNLPDSLKEHDLSEGDHSGDTVFDVQLTKLVLSLATPPPLPPKPQQMNQQQVINTSYDLKLLSSQLTHQEVVKDDRVYKTQTLANPTTWAIQIQVKDTGPGIEPALQEKVFEPFIQGDQTLLRSYGGTGLGLSICRQLATMMNGTLTLNSVVGQGLTFTFTVPLKQTGEVVVDDNEMEAFCDDEFNPDAKVNRKVAFQEPEVSSEDEPLPPISLTEADTDTSPNLDDHPAETSNLPRRRPKMLRDKLMLLSKPDLITKGSTGTAALHQLDDNEIISSLKHIRILVAEDNMVNQEVIKRMLKLEGFTNVIMANDGAEAVDKVKQLLDLMDFFDLIFMDVQMPKIDGLLATKMIRNNLGFKRPIIALTAFADESNVKECLAAEMSGFLAKPIRRSNIKKVITQFAPQLLGEALQTPLLESRAFKFTELKIPSPTDSPTEDTPPKKSPQ